MIALQIAGGIVLGYLGILAVNRLLPQVTTQRRRSAAARGRIERWYSSHPWL